MKQLLVLLSVVLLTACSPALPKQEEKSSSSIITGTSQAQPEETEIIEASDGKWVGNDDIGYMNLDEAVIDFQDYNNNPDLANTQQWFDTSLASILSLTSVPKTNYSHVLEVAADAWEGYQEVDVLLEESLQAFLDIEGADVKADYDTFNELFYDTALGWVDIVSGDETTIFLVVIFQPEKDSDQLYILSSEGEDAESVRDLLLRGLYTWTAKNNEKR